MTDKRSDFLLYLRNERKVSENTCFSYEFDLKNYYDFLKEKNLDAEKITRDEIREYLKYLDQLKYSSKTIARHLSCLRSYYDYLLECHLVEVNLFKNIKSPKLDKKLPNYLDYEDLNKLLDVFDLDNPLELRNKLIIEMFYSTGIRISELVSIKVNDLSHREIKVYGKGAKERIVYYGDYVEELLDLYLIRRKELLKNKTSDYLFINNRGDPLTDSGVREMLSNVLKKIALKNNITPHTLRHTFATHMLNEGADLKSVQELLGHTNLSTTSIYTHVSNERLRSVYLNAHPRNKRKEN